MPEGQFGGSRATYEYIAESGAVYQLSLDETLGGITDAGLNRATTDTTATPAPKRFKPRGVYWEGTLDSKVRRKFIVCASTSTLYQSDTSQDVTIDGVAGKTTGRRGETLSFLKLDAATPAP